ncbi:Dynein assembly factor 1, partial [Durusdinium trenchii]
GDGWASLLSHGNMEDDVAWYKVRAPLLVVRRCPIAEAEEIHELVQEQRVQAQSWTAGWLRLTDVEMWISSCSKQEGFIPLEDAGMPAVLQLSGNECPGGDWDQWAGLLHWWPLGGVPPVLPATFGGAYLCHWIQGPQIKAEWIRLGEELQLARLHSTTAQDVASWLRQDIGLQAEHDATWTTTWPWMTALG